MTAPRRVAPARVLAALDVLGWPDDRERSAHIEPDGHEVTPARHYWETVEDVIRAADGAAPSPTEAAVRKAQADAVRGAAHGISGPLAGALGEAAGRLVVSTLEKIADEIEGVEQR